MKKTKGEVFEKERLWNMIQRVFRFLIVGGVILTSGCTAMFPTSRSTTGSRWRSFAEVQAAFDQIAPNRTTVTDLKTLGFDPASSPNVKILTYVDIIKHFMPNQAIQKQDLAEPVRLCIEAKEQSVAYEVSLKDIQSQRHGNLFLDIFGFKRKTHETGWEFNGLILIKDNIVVYKLASGEPQISRDERRARPLGPVQELDNPLSTAAGLVK